MHRARDCGWKLWILAYIHCRICSNETACLMFVHYLADWKKSLNTYHRSDDNYRVHVTMLLSLPRDLSCLTTDYLPTILHDHRSVFCSSSPTFYRYLSNGQSPAKCFHVRPKGISPYSSDSPLQLWTLSTPSIRREAQRKERFSVFVSRDHDADATPLCVQTTCRAGRNNMLRCIFVIFYAPLDTIRFGHRQWIYYNQNEPKLPRLIWRLFLIERVCTTTGLVLSRLYPGVLAVECLCVLGVKNHKGTLYWQAD